MPAADRLADPRRDRVGVQRIDEHRGAVRDLLHRRARARHNRHSTRERLEHRNAEAFVQRRVGDAERTAIETRELLVVDEAEQAHPAAAKVAVAPSRRAGHA